MCVSEIMCVCEVSVIIISIVTKYISRMITMKTFFLFFIFAGVFAYVLLKPHITNPSC